MAKQIWLCIPNLLCMDRNRQYEKKNLLMNVKFRFVTWLLNLMSITRQKYFTTNKDSLLYNYFTTIKIKILIFISSYHLIIRLIAVTLTVSIMYFMDNGPSSKSDTSHSMFISQSGNTPLSFLDFPHIGTFKVIVECEPVWVWYFFIIRVRLCISGWNNHKNVVVLVSSELK